MKILPISSLEHGTGFTIVELVTVLLLLGILSAFAVSKLMGASSFRPSLVVQESMALLRFSLSQAQARQDLGISFVLDQSGSDWRFRVLADRTGSAAELRTAMIAHSDAAIRVLNGVGQTHLDSSTALVIDFDGLGSIVSSTAGATVLNPDLGIGLEVSGDATFNLCVAPGGFAFRGACG